MELPFAALHQLCAPLLEGLPALPQPQQAALEVALGLATGDPPDRFLVALAALSLVSEAGAHQPLLCLIDDAHWLDSASRQAFGFMARRLLAECVAMVFAVRTPAQESDLSGLPVMHLEGLADGDARTLLESVILRKLDVSARDRLLAEARGNPLALLELPRRMSPAQLPGALGLLAPHELPTSIEDSFIQRLHALPDDARILLLVAAAEPARRLPGVVGCRPAAGHRRLGCVGDRDRGAADGRRARPVPAPPREVGGLSIGLTRRSSPGSPGLGRFRRRGPRRRPSCLASRRCHRRAR